MKILARKHYLYWLLSFLFLLAACNNSISRFSGQAYQQDVTLKVESLALMNKADEPFEKHAKEINKLKEKMEIAFEYARGRPKNGISTRQWKIMISPERHLMGGFLQRWQDKSVLSPYFIKQASKNISEAFDSIIYLESGKIKPQEVK